MTPKQKDVVWALGVVLFVFFGCMWASTQNDYCATLSILASWFIYTGAREMLDKNYRREMAIWSLKIAAQADNKPFDPHKAAEQSGSA